MDKLKIGIVGAAGRPTAFLRALQDSGKAELTAACDINREAMNDALEGLNIEKYTDYIEMLERAGLDAVIVGTPLPFHVSQSKEALDRGISVYSEVPAAETLEECRILRNAVKNSRAMYMFGENILFAKSYMQVESMVKAGKFGEILYAEGEYLHDCRELIEKTPWRKKSLYETSGLTYGTHNLGPILRWFPNDRITAVCCAGSGRGTDMQLRGDNVSVMLCRTQKGRLIKLRMDISSPHPYALNFCLQGTKGAFQSTHRSGTEDDYVFFEGDSDWRHISTLENEYLPNLWKESSAGHGGHGGADSVSMTAFIEALFKGSESPADVDEGLDMTIPGIMSRESIMNGGIWVEVPDSRTWDK